VAALSRTQTVGEVVEAMIAELKEAAGGSVPPLSMPAPAKVAPLPPPSLPASLTHSMALSVRCPGNTLHTVGEVVDAMKTGTNGFLDSHVIRGRRVLPMTCSVAYIASSVLDSYPGYHLQALEDAQLFSGIDVDADIDIALSLKRDASATTEGPFAVSAMLTKAAKKAGGRPQPAYKAKVVLAASKPTTPTVPASCAGIAASAPAVPATQLYDGRTLFHGALLQGIVSAQADDAGLRARCKDIALSATEAGQFSGGASAVNGFAADVMLQAMLVWARHKHGVASLPAQVGALEWHRPLPAGGEYLLTLAVSLSDATSVEATCYFHDAAGLCYMVGRGLKVVLNETLEYTLPSAAKVPKAMPTLKPTAEVDPRIAVIGIAVNYASAPNLDAFWTMLCANQSGCHPASAQRLASAATRCTSPTAAGSSAPTPSSTTTTAPSRVL